MGPYLAVFFVTAGTVFLATPVVRMLARRVGAIVPPSTRKVHTRPIPTLGGVGMALGVLVGVLVASLIPGFRVLFRLSSPEIRALVIAALVIAAVGVVDDLRALSAPAKVAGQVLAAGLLVLNGVQLLFFYVPTQGTVSLGSDLAVPLTILWVLIVVNAVNLIDGLDGLAAGTVVIAAAAFFVYAYLAPTAFPDAYPTVVQNANLAALISALAAGAAAGFLPHNFFPARIIMGDTGSMLLGLLLAAATIAGIGQTVQISTLGPTPHDVAPFALPALIPILILALPLMDVVLAVIRRLRRHQKWYAPDKEHIHHQLIEIGHTHRQAVLLMYLWSAVVAGAMLSITYARNRATIVIAVGFAALVIGVTVIPRVVRAVRRGATEAGRGAGAAGV
jgi:UDP-GlcNAc:undecaprenyl-phosphate/decaprenyl-phosphate GlcNAc-1-phosphate transferase